MSSVLLLLRSGKINFLKKSLQNHCTRVASDLLAGYILDDITKSKCRQDMTPCWAGDFFLPGRLVLAQKKGQRHWEAGVESSLICVWIFRAVRWALLSGVAAACVWQSHRWGLFQSCHWRALSQQPPWDFSPHFQPHVCISSTPLQAEHHFWEMLWQFLYP